MMYEDLVKKLRRCGKGLCTEDCPDWTKENLYHTCQDELVLEAADAIEELSRQRDRAYARLCEWCGVCPEGKRNAEDCEIAALNPEPPEEEAK